MAELTEIVEWTALFFFSGLNLGQVPGPVDRNCGEWTALFFFSGLNLGHVLGRDDTKCGECGGSGDDALPVLEDGPAAQARAKSKRKAKATT